MSKLALIGGAVSLITAIVGVYVYRLGVVALAEEEAVLLRGRNYLKNAHEVFKGLQEKCILTSNVYESYLELMVTLYSGIGAIAALVRDGNREAIGLNTRFNNLLERAEKWKSDFK